MFDHYRARLLTQENATIQPLTSVSLALPLFLRSLLSWRLSSHILHPFCQNSSLNLLTHFLLSLHPLSHPTPPSNFAIPISSNVYATPDLGRRICQLHRYSHHLFCRLPPLPMHTYQP
uniref:Uncharacterized protein n=1 Tax=Opuntia streptacantha TaxID=393608 RepID=A0A7C8ZJ57_OPUST